MIRLAPRLVPDWPKLTWAASWEPGGEEVLVRHGPFVEVGDGWLVEAAWAGDFTAADFDRTDLIAGSGVRQRDGEVVFVSSGSAVDRLWHCRRNGHLHVANSLPAILAVADVRLLDDYLDYPRDIQTIDEGFGGLHHYRRRFPTDAGQLEVLYFANLRFDGTELREEPKPDRAPPLRTYTDYFEFLTGTAAALSANAASPDRRIPIVPVTTVSSGYDSCAVAAIAHHGGCRHAVTIENSTSLWRGSDSGAEVARHLGLSCREFRHTPAAYRREEAVWAAVGRPRGLNYTVFDLPQPLSLLMTGNYGDKIWDLSYGDVSEPTGDLSGLCLCEYRLIEGILHCMPAWWGVRHSEEIRRINASEEMAPWTLGNDYDRPIARRILEEAGVPRGTFAVRKKNASSESEFWWPYSRPSQASFRGYLRRRGLYAPGPALVSMIRRAARAENLFYKNLARKVGIRGRIRPWNRIVGTRLLFQWANHELKRHYRAALAGESHPVATGDRWEGRADG